MVAVRQAALVSDESASEACLTTFTFTFLPLTNNFLWHNSHKTLYSLWTFVKVIVNTKLLKL